MRNLIRPAIAFALIILFASCARADDAFYSVSLKDLKIQWPQPQINNQYPSRVSRVLVSSVILDQPAGEAYLVNYDQNLEGESVVIRAPQGVAVTARIYFNPVWMPSSEPVKLNIDPALADSKARVAFFEGKYKYYQVLASHRFPGGAWFRYQANQAAVKAGHKPEEINPPTPNGRNSDDDFAETIDLFSGGRAVSENLQLDRALFPRAGGDRSVPIESIKGIDVKAMDWNPLIANLHPAVDKLATLIPGDQHGIFFPSFAAAMKAFDEADLRSTPIIEQFESSSQDAGTRERYRRQLCLPETELGSLLGPNVIAAMAVTGSDPYLRVGSDVAVLFQPTGPLDLHALLLSGMKIAAARGAGADGEPAVVNGLVSDITYIGFVSPGRRICAYLATVDGIQIVTNSLVQLQRLADVRAGKSPAISAAPEYTFFRNRYPATDSQETAFVMLPDAAIRRWCSPRWRLADSRRTRAAAVMMDLQAQHADELITGKKAQPATSLSTDDDLKMTAAGVQSAVYGTLDFMTPISELQIDKVTQAEATMYGRWRDTYQQNWSNYSDPIGARFSLLPDRTAVDVSVMPLIVGSDYREIVNISTGVKIGPDSGDRHPDLFHIAMAVNRNAEMMKQGAGMLTGIGGVDIDPLGWIGPTVSLYLDEDPIWQKIAAEKNPDQFLEQHISDLPVVLYLQSSNTLKLAGFLIALHAFADTSAPGMTVWGNVKYGQSTYTKIIPSDQAKEGNAPLQNISICYAVSGGALLISPNEAALKRAMDRQSARAIAATQPVEAKAVDAPPWLGENLCAQVNIAAAQKVLTSVLQNSYQLTAQDRAWANLPILNEWHRHFPGVDPVKVQAQLFQNELRDPAGGQYTWNDAAQTMESANYGCPAKPKNGPVWPTGLAGIDKANFGITFENQGVRARFELQK